MERERLRDPEAKETTYYERLVSDRAQWVDRQMTGELLVRSKDREYQMTRQGYLKNYLSPHIPETALSGWSVFIQDIRRQSGRHRHQGGILIYVIEGEGVTEVNGHMLSWRAGDLLLLPIQPKGVAHQHFNNDNTKKCRWIAFRHPAFRDITSSAITQLEESPDVNETGQLKAALKGKRVFDDWKAGVPGDQAALVTHPDELASINLFDQLILIRDQQRARLAKATWLIRGEELPWELNAHGRMQWYLHPCIAYSVVNNHLFYKQEIAPGSRSGLQHRGGDVVFFVLKGQGYTEVDGVRYDWEDEDVMTLPLRPDGVTFRHVNTGSEPAVLIGTEPNYVHSVGVDRNAGFEQLQPCPEYRLAQST